MRCVAVAEAFRHRGWRPIFLLNDEARDYLPAALLNGLEIRCASEDARAQLPAIIDEAGHISLAVVDSYRLDATYEAAFREFRIKVMVIDDIPTRQHDCDWLLDTAQPSNSAQYDGLIPASCRKLFGPDYVSIRSEIRDSRLYAEKKGERELKVFVSFGASNVGGGIELALRAAGMFGTKPGLTVATSSSNAAAVDLAETEGVDVLLDRSDIGPALAASTIAIGAGGVAAWERCYLGVPSVILTTAENQLAIASLIARAGAATYLGDVRDVGPETLAAAVEALWVDAGARAEMSRNGQTLVDGRGGERIVDAVTA